MVSEIFGEIVENSASWIKRFRQFYNLFIINLIWLFAILLLAFAIDGRRHFGEPQWESDSIIGNQIVK
jgi:hypothetical protein